MKYQKIIKTSIVVLTMVFILVCTSLYFSFSDRIVLPHDSVTILENGWTINCKGQIISSNNLSHAGIGVINELEKVTIPRIIDDVGFVNPCLSFFSIHFPLNYYQY